MNTNDEFDLGNVPDEYKERVRNLLNNNRKLFATKMTELGTATQVKHTIRLKSNVPICLPYRRTPETQKKVMKEHIEEMEAHGIIRESTIPYAAPVLMVPKKTGDQRFWSDYRRLNSDTEKDKYPIPRTDVILDALYGTQFFSSLDLFSGYWQIEIEESDKHKTAFVCEFGHYEFNRMPFGLTNAA